MSGFTPRTFEDRLLAAYHEDVGGRIYTEVAVAWGRGYMDWSPGYNPRRIDAIRLCEPYHEEIIVPFAKHGTEVLRVVEDANIELIEIKKNLGRGVIGQVVAGRELFSADYGAAEIQSLALVSNTDSALEWVCDQLNITVETTEPVEKSD